MYEKIFISYHRKNSDKKDELVEILEELNYDVNIIDEDHIFDGRKHQEIAQICIDEIEDCDVTICIVGNETYRRSHVDHEIKVSLRGGFENRKGLIAVMLEERGDSKNNIELNIFPNRIQDNISDEFNYVVLEQWASIRDKIRDAIDEAEFRRTEHINVKNNRTLMELRQGRYYNQPFN